MTKTASVPCGACTLCCRGGEAIVLHPECGDNPKDYRTRVVWNPFKGDGPITILEQDPVTHDCVYVGPFGCTIWEKRPVICREFDCRGMVRKLTPKSQRALLAAGVLNMQVINRGRELIAKEEAQA